MNSNWTGHQGVGVRGMVAARRGKKSHFGTCPGATGETARRFWVGVSCKFGEVCVVLRKHGSCVFNDLYQFDPICSFVQSECFWYTCAVAKNCILLHADC